MFVAICYDITNDRTRRHIAKWLEAYGERVQKSTFECRISEEQLMAIKSKLRDVRLAEGDLIRFYIMCKTCRDRVEFIGGKAPCTQVPGHLVL